jgi:hypothetical protein
VAAGIPDDLYWRSTPVETGALLTALIERQSRQEHAAALRAGLVAAEIRNTMRQKSSDKVWQPHHFVRERRPVDQPRIVSREEFIQQAVAFATAHNARLPRRARA